MSHHNSLLESASFRQENRIKGRPVPVQKLNSMWLLADDCNPLLILLGCHNTALRSGGRSVQACRCPLHSLTLRPATAPRPALTLSPLPISTFSLFIYCVEDLKPQIDLWDWFGNTLLPPPSFPSPPLPFPPLRLFLKRLLINPATSSVSCGAKKKKKKKRVKWKDGGRDRESDEGKGENKAAMGGLYYPGVKVTWSIW